MFTILYGYLKRAKQHNFINLESPHLCHSRFSSKDVSGITLPCGKKRCLTCPFVFNEVYTVEGLEVNLLLQEVFLVSPKMSFIALNVLDVERFISGKQKGG